MTWVQNAEYSSARNIRGKNAPLQEAAFSNRSERMQFTSWQSWRNFWRSLLSFSLIRSSLAASRFFLCLVKKNNNRDEKPWNKHLMQNHHLLSPLRDTHWICMWHVASPAHQMKGISDPQLRICLLTCLLKFNIYLVLLPVKICREVSRVLQVLCTEFGLLIWRPQESSNCLPKNTRKGSVKMQQ